MNAEQKKWHSDSAEEFKIVTADGLAGVTKAGQDLATESKRIATAVSDLGKIKTDASAAFQDLTDAGKAQISQIGDATKSNVAAAADKLTREAEKVGAGVDRLIQLQKDTEKNNQFGGTNPFGRRPGNDGNLTESRKLDQRVPEPRPIVSAPALLERPSEVKRVPFSTAADLSHRHAKKWWHLRNPFSKKKS